MTENNRWGIIYSPHAGMYKAHNRWRQIRKYIERKGVTYDFVQSESFGSVGRLASMLCNNGYSTIVIVGGDNAFSDAINAIMPMRDTLSKDFALGLIPNGVGNDFARFWGLDVDDYVTSIDRIIERRTRPIDVASCVYHDDGIPQLRYFINCINIGLGAKLIKASNDAQRLLGKSRLSLIPVVISNIFSQKSFKMELKIDTETVNGEYMSVCIGNCLGYGQTPNAVPYNGLLDISVITRPKWWQLFEGFWLLGKGRFLNYKNVHPYRAEKVIINSIGKGSFSIDGMVLQGKDVGTVKLTVEKEAINFIV